MLPRSRIGEPNRPPSPDRLASRGYSAADSGRIGRILVHPTNADIVYACVLGRATGPSSDRGVFRTQDGGAHWTRVLDAGQCNDSYSLAVIALKLKDVFGLDDINKLPISFDIAWYEQKAVLVLLALLHLGVKGIRLGPTLPGFLSPAVVKVLVENFDIKPITTVAADLPAALAGH